ncbi:hypothetical protein QFZ32_000022 [Streptomyces canus]|nr:hypothetical protein [Streptomyces canus]
MRSHYGEPVHKACAEDWIAANPTEGRLGRFASDVPSAGATTTTPEFLPRRLP